MTADILKRCGRRLAGDGWTGGAIRTQAVSDWGEWADRVCFGDGVVGRETGRTWAAKDVVGETRVHIRMRGIVRYAAGKMSVGGEGGKGRTDGAGQHRAHQRGCAGRRYAERAERDETWTTKVWTRTRNYKKNKKKTNNTRNLEIETQKEKKKRK